jgi:hypothetical protein
MRFALLPPLFRRREISLASPGGSSLGPAGDLVRPPALPCLSSDVSSSPVPFGSYYRDYARLGPLDVRLFHPVGSGVRRLGPRRLSLCFFESARLAAFFLYIIFLPFSPPL